LKSDDRLLPVDPQGGASRSLVRENESYHEYIC
jgi:hypothetical protein